MTFDLLFGFTTKGTSQITSFIVVVNFITIAYNNSLSKDGVSFSIGYVEFIFETTNDFDQNEDKPQVNMRICDYDLCEPNKIVFAMWQAILDAHVITQDGAEMSINAWLACKIV